MVFDRGFDKGVLQDKNDFSTKLFSIQHKHA